VRERDFMIESRRSAVVASLIAALLIFGTPAVAFADEKGDPKADNKTVEKDKDNGKDAKKGDENNDAKKRDEDAKKDDGKRHEEARKSEDHKDGDWKDRDHGDDHNRNWDHDRDRYHRRHDGRDTHRRYYRYGYYGPGYYDDCGYYGHRYGGYDDDYYYYGPDACSYEYGRYGTHYLARMSGEEVIPDRGPRDAYGTANLDIDPSAGRVCFRLAYDGIPEATGAQIRYGRRGENGPAVVLLHVGHNGDDGCVPADPQVLYDIQTYPWAYHLRVDADRFPNGAMRGQLEAPDYRRY
jgi:hypothetical protein